MMLLSSPWGVRFGSNLKVGQPFNSLGGHRWPWEVLGALSELLIRELERMVGSALSYSLLQERSGQTPITCAKGFG
jgi:hypothetical protein